MESLDKQRQDTRQFVKHAMEIAMLLGKIRDQKGWSNSKFAKTVGVNESEVSKWLGGTQNFTIRTIAKIENALGVEIVRQFSDAEIGLGEVEKANTDDNFWVTIQAVVA
jgi:transcriptional regulator with XRE-family HTH domain